MRKAKDGRLTLVEDSFSSRTGGGMGRSEMGSHRIEEWDFPPPNLTTTVEDRYPQSSESVIKN